ncbi:MAG: hypothetical protein WD269_00560 [Acidimicrobiia bacterium]
MGYPLLTDADLLSPTVELMGQGRGATDIANLVEEAVSTCLQLRGWTYEPVLQDMSSMEPRTVGEERRFRAAYGYGEFSTPTSGDDDARAAADRNYDRFRGLTRREQISFRRDLNGGVEDGETSLDDDSPLPGSCLADARQESGLAIYDQALMNDMRQMGEAAITSAESVAANRAWSECMKALGYELESPADAQLQAVAEGQTLPIAEAIANEVRIATDDFECQVDTRLAWRHQAELSIVRALIERYPEYGDG